MLASLSRLLLLLFPCQPPFSLDFTVLSSIRASLAPFSPPDLLSRPRRDDSLGGASIYLTLAHPSHTSRAVSGIVSYQAPSKGPRCKGSGKREESSSDDSRLLERRRKEVASLLARASDRWRWALSSPPPLAPTVIHHLGLFFTYFICNIFRNFYSVNRSPRAAAPDEGWLIKQRRTASWTIHPELAGSCNGGWRRT